MTLPTLFVAGASGKFGRRVVELLLERGYDGKIIAGSRTPEKLADLKGVEVRKADYGDTAFATALAGVDRVLLTSTDAIGEARIRLQTAAVAAAKAAGVKHIVYTSMPHPEPGNIVPMAADHYATEQAVKGTGTAYTIVRNSWYAENLLQQLPPALASGKWYSASGEGAIAHVSRDDTARAAAGALLADHDGSRVFTVAGRVALTNHQIAAIASELLGRRIEVVDVPDAGFTEGLKQAGLPAPVAELLTTFEIGQRRGILSMATNAVEELWGTPAIDVRTFLAAHRASLLQAA